MYDETLTPTKLALIHTGIKSYLSFNRKKHDFCNKRLEIKRSSATQNTLV